MSGPLELTITAVSTPRGAVSITTSVPSAAPSHPTSTTTTTTTGTTSAAPNALPALLLLHSNSASSKAFRHILSRPPAGVSRVVAMDFLGHGLSADAAVDPDAAYTQRGYAECAVSVLTQLGLADVVLLGWSLGGHVAIEMVPLLAHTPGPACRGIMIVGAPPANGLAQTSVGFGKAGAVQDAQAGAQAASPFARELWSEHELESLPYALYREPRERWMVDDCRRTDGRARRIMFDAFNAGSGVDQRAVLRDSGVLCAVVNGGDEPFVNLDYVDAVEYGNLWEGRCHRMPGLGHAPFWEQPEAFGEYLQRFVRDCNAPMAGQRT